MERTTDPLTRETLRGLSSQPPPTTSFRVQAQLCSRTLFSPDRLCFAVVVESWVTAWGAAMILGGQMGALFQPIPPLSQEELKSDGEGHWGIIYFTRMVWTLKKKKGWERLI